jgi:hypothetical protein
MTNLILIIIAIIAVVLTLWLIVIPAGMVASGFTAFRHGGRGWHDWKKPS